MVEYGIMPRKAAVCIAAFMINCVRPTYAKITVKMNLPTIAKYIMEKEQLRICWTF